MLLNTVLMFAIAANIVGAIYNITNYRRLLASFKPIGYVQNVPGQGPQLLMSFTELPPIGTVFYLREKDKFTFEP